jgi:hypothetical protein
MSLPKKCIVDTNVPINANLANDPAAIPENLVTCIYRCVEAIEYVMKKGEFVIDSGDEIYKEYLNNLCPSGKKGIGNAFMKWVHDNRWSLPDSDRVVISKKEDSYDEFPVHDGLVNFDKSDRKFVAVANAHPAKQPILQSTDSKWWGWKDALKDVGITVHFLCPDYVETKYAEKIGA